MKGLKNQITLIFGKTGSGKTYLTKSIIKKLNKNNLIIYDPNKEYSNEHVYNIEQMKERIKNKQFPIFCFFKYDKDFELSFELLFEVKNVTIIIDEFHAFVSKYAKKSSMIPLIRFHRHINQSYIFVTQRITDIQRDIMSQVNFIITFVQSDLKDLAYLDSYGIDSEKVKTLKQYDYILKRVN